MERASGSNLKTSNILKATKKALDLYEINRQKCIDKYTDIDYNNACVKRHKQENSLFSYFFKYNTLRREDFLKEVYDSSDAWIMCRNDLFMYLRRGHADYQVLKRLDTMAKKLPKTSDMFISTEDFAYLAKYYD